MAHIPKKLQFASFNTPDDPLLEFDHIPQVAYLRCYLDELEAETIIEEGNYFDRDYLAEFSAFYSISSKGYPNVCRRLHFFSGPRFSRRLVQSAAGGNTRSIRRLQDHYLGFVVIRPIPVAPLGRTVLRWYKDDERNKSTPRIIEPAREYSVHLAGIRLTVTGLAWQQQDTGVGACATVGLWTMFHSSAFDDHHAIPTTADITRSAHRRASLGTRMFPSTGLTIHQICEAVKEQNLAPVISEGDKQEDGKVIGFSKERFSASCASFIRSGYPVLIIGRFGDSGHAVCAVGFRSCPPPAANGGQVCLQDGDIEYLYVHDDNIGPSVRFKIDTDKGTGIVSLSPSAPPLRRDEPRVERKTRPYDSLTPTQLLVAVHTDLRTSPDKLHVSGLYKAIHIAQVLNALAKAKRIPSVGLTLSTRFVKLAGYMTAELKNTLGANSALLGKVRLALAEKVPPMSLHLGVVRIGLDDSTPLIDVLFDTTDSDRNHPVYAHVAYEPFLVPIIRHLESNRLGEFGILVEAF